MAFSINEVRANFQFEGARPTLFTVNIFNPVNSVADNAIQFLASATSIPESKLGDIPVPYFGRIVHFAGDRTYDAWTVRIMNDEDFKVRNALEQWSDAINKKVQNTRSQLNYKSTATVNQLSKSGTTVRTYRFNGLYPAEIQPIRLDWGATNQFETFDVTFVYDYWEVTGGNTGNAGGV
jgi:T4-like virus tail tube protein gp19